MPDEKKTLRVGGMTCTGCATTVKNALEKEGATDVYVDFSMGEAVFSKTRFRSHRKVYQSH
ncbi:MAG: heavy-metal-associated domain-containing protein [Bacteroidetes bacterium]|nr:MAG: heavy-metal-associated domain-containing protein [Bacteroidota bacterium]